MALRAVDQLAMDERVVEDGELAGLLEKRLRAQDDKREVAGVYKLADQAAKEAIAKHELTDGDAIRVGRFRITKIATEARHVEFDAAPGSRLTIGLWEERDQPAPASRPRSRPVSVGAVLRKLDVDTDDGTSPTDDGEAPGSADVAAEADALHALAMAGEAPASDDDDLIPF